MNSDDPVVVRYFHRLCLEAREQVRNHEAFERQIRAKGLKPEEVPVALLFRDGVIYREMEEASALGLLIHYHLDTRQIDFVKINVNIRSSGERTP